MLCVYKHEQNFCQQKYIFNAYEYFTGDEVVFQCRDEGLLRARVNWSRADGRQLPPGSTQVKGRLEIPNIQMEHSGAYVCEALGVPPNTPGNRKTVYLQVEPGIYTKLLYTNQ